MNQFFFLSPRKKIGTPTRFCLVRNVFPMPRVKLFYPKDYLIYFFTHSLYFFFPTVQGCPACHAVRRARTKVFREESERLFENINNNKQTFTPSKHLLSAKNIF